MSARVAWHHADDPHLRMVLTHGAGGGIDARDLVMLAQVLPAAGISVALVEMPWRVAGRKVAPPPPAIDKAYREVIADLSLPGPWVLGGRSAGARSACRIAREEGAAGVLALAFPLHPPGRPEKSRLEELLGVGLPTLVMQGDRDPFGGPAEFGTLPDNVRILAVTGADHGMKTLKSAARSQEETLGHLGVDVIDWARAEVPGNRPG